MNEYKLTAIVLVYNGEPYLTDCIQSLVDQTIEGLEILLINDASTDDSLSICRKFEKEHDNVFVIDKEKNSGLASSANLGIEHARGEYIILVDNDDIIPNYAYKKLYDKAKEVDADVSIGKANLFSKYQMELSFFDYNAWTEEKVITDINEYPKLFHDLFYWNKIIKKDLLISNNIRMPEEIKVYADCCFTHKVYSFAKKISIIPDCVYLWRKRDTSLSRTYYTIPNFNDRINAYELDMNYLMEYYPNSFNTIYRRALMPIKGILKDKEFEKVFFKRTLKFFKKYMGQVDDIYDNVFKEIENIYAYLIINGHNDELKELLETDLTNQSEIFNDNGKSYWKLPQFRNPKLNIPDDLFEIRYLQEQFIHIDEITVNEDSIIFRDIELPKYFDLVKGEILFKGSAEVNEIFSEFCSSFEIQKKDMNIYDAEIPLKDLSFFEFYGIYFKFENKLGYTKEVRLSTKYINNIINNNNEIRLFGDSKNILRMISQQLNDVFDIDCTTEELILKINNPDKIKKEIRVYLKNNNTYEKVFLSLNDSKTEYSLKWKLFLDNDTQYTFFMRIFDNAGKLKKDIKMNKKYVRNIDEINKKNNDIPIKFRTTKKNVVKFKSK